MGVNSHWMKPKNEWLIFKICFLLNNVVYLITLTMCPWFDVLICLLVHNISFFSLWRDIRFVLFLWYMLIGTLIIFLLNDPQNITIRLMLCIYIVYRSRPSSSGQTQFIILRHHNDFIHQVLDKYCLLFASSRSNAGKCRLEYYQHKHPIGSGNTLVWILMQLHCGDWSREHGRQYKYT